MGLHRSDSILQTVLDTANEIDADERYEHPGSSNMQDNNARVIDVATTESGSSMPSIGDHVPSGVDFWPRGLEEEVPLWDGIDFAAFLENDDAMLLQTTLEKLAGLIG